MKKLTFIAASLLFLSFSLFSYAQGDSFAGVGFVEEVVLRIDPTSQRSALEGYSSIDIAAIKATQEQYQKKNSHVFHYVFAPGVTQKTSLIMVQEVYRQMQVQRKGGFILVVSGDSSALESLQGQLHSKEIFSIPKEELTFINASSAQSKINTLQKQNRGIVFVNYRSLKSFLKLAQESIANEIIMAVALKAHKRLGTSASRQDNIAKGLQQLETFLNSEGISHFIFSHKEDVYIGNPYKGGMRFRVAAYHNDEALEKPTYLLGIDHAYKIGAPGIRPEILIVDFETGFNTSDETIRRLALSYRQEVMAKNNQREGYSEHQKLFSQAKVAQVLGVIRWLSDGMRRGGGAKFRPLQKEFGVYRTTGMLHASNINEALFYEGVINDYFQATEGGVAQVISSEMSTEQITRIKSDWKNGKIALLISVAMGREWSNSRMTYVFAPHTTSMERLYDALGSLMPWQKGRGKSERGFLIHMKAMAQDISYYSSAEENANGIAPQDLFGYSKLQKGRGFAKKSASGFSLLFEEGRESPVRESTFWLTRSKVYDATTVSKKVKKVQRTITGPQHPRYFSGHTEISGYYDLNTFLALEFPELRNPELISTIFSPLILMIKGRYVEYHEWGLREKYILLSFQGKVFPLEVAYNQKTLHKRAVFLKVQDGKEMLYFGEELLPLMVQFVLSQIPLPLKFKHQHGGEDSFLFPTIVSHLPTGYENLYLDFSTLLQEYAPQMDILKKKELLGGVLEVFKEQVAQEPRFREQGVWSISVSPEEMLFNETSDFSSNEVYEMVGDENTQEYEFSFKERLKFPPLQIIPHENELGFKIYAHEKVAVPLFHYLLKRVKTFSLPVQEAQKEVLDKINSSFASERGGSYFEITEKKITENLFLYYGGDKFKKIHEQLLVEVGAAFSQRKLKIKLGNTWYSLSRNTFWNSYEGDLYYFYDQKLTQYRLYISSEKKKVFFRDLYLEARTSWNIMHHEPQRRALIEYLLENNLGRYKKLGDISYPEDNFLTSQDVEKVFNYLKELLLQVKTEQENFSLSYEHGGEEQVLTLKNLSYQKLKQYAATGELAPHDFFILENQVYFKRQALQKILKNRSLIFFLGRKIKKPSKKYQKQAFFNERTATYESSLVPPQINVRWLTNEEGLREELSKVTYQDESRNKRQAQIGKRIVDLYLDFLKDVYKTAFKNPQVFAEKGLLNIKKGVLKLSTLELNLWGEGTLSIARRVQNSGEVQWLFRENYFNHEKLYYGYREYLEITFAHQVKQRKSAGKNVQETYYDLFSHFDVITFDADFFTVEKENFRGLSPKMYHTLSQALVLGLFYQLKKNPELPLRIGGKNYFIFTGEIKEGVNYLYYCEKTDQVVSNFSLTGVWIKEFLEWVIHHRLILETAEIRSFLAREYQKVRVKNKSDYMDGYSFYLPAHYNEGIRKGELFEDFFDYYKNQEYAQKPAGEELISEEELVEILDVFHQYIKEKVLKLAESKGSDVGTTTFYHNGENYLLAIWPSIKKYQKMSDQVSNPTGGRLVHVIYEKEKLILPKPYSPEILLDFMAFGPIGIVEKSTLTYARVLEIIERADRQQELFLKIKKLSESRQGSFFEIPKDIAEFLEGEKITWGNASKNTKVLITEIMHQSLNIHQSQAANHSEYSLYAEYVFFILKFLFSVQENASQKLEIPLDTFYFPNKEGKIYEVLGLLQNSTNFTQDIETLMYEVGRLTFSFSAKKIANIFSGNEKLSQLHKKITSLYQKGKPYQKNKKTKESLKKGIPNLNSNVQKKLEKQGWVFFSLPHQNEFNKNEGNQVIRSADSNLISLVNELLKIYQNGINENTPGVREHVKTCYNYVDYLFSFFIQGKSSHFKLYKVKNSRGQESFLAAFNFNTKKIHAFAWELIKHLQKQGKLLIPSRFQALHKKVVNFFSYFSSHFSQEEFYYARELDENSPYIDDYLSQVDCMSSWEKMSEGDFSQEFTRLVAALGNLRSLGDGYGPLAKLVGRFIEAVSFSRYLEKNYPTYKMRKTWTEEIYEAFQQSFNALLGKKRLQAKTPAQKIALAREVAEQVNRLSSLFGMSWMGKTLPHENLSEWFTEWKKNHVYGSKLLGEFSSFVLAGVLSETIRNYLFNDGAYTLPEVATFFDIILGNIGPFAMFFAGSQSIKVFHELLSRQYYELLRRTRSLHELSRVLMSNQSSGAYRNLLSRHYFRSVFPMNALGLLGGVMSMATIYRRPGQNWAQSVLESITFLFPAMIVTRVSSHFLGRGLLKSTDLLLDAAGSLKRVRAVKDIGKALALGTGVIGFAITVIELTLASVAEEGYHTGKRVKGERTELIRSFRELVSCLQRTDNCQKEWQKKITPHGKSHYYSVYQDNEFESFLTRARSYWSYTIGYNTNFEKSKYLAALKSYLSGHSLLGYKSFAGGLSTPGIFGKGPHQNLILSMPLFEKNGDFSQTVRGETYRILHEIQQRRPFISRNHTGWWRQYDFSELQNEDRSFFNVLGEVNALQQAQFKKEGAQRTLFSQKLKVNTGPLKKVLKSYQVYRKNLKTLVEKNTRYLAKVLSQKNLQKRERELSSYPQYVQEKMRNHTRQLLDSLREILSGEKLYLEKDQAVLEAHWGRVFDDYNFVRDFFQTIGVGIAQDTWVDESKLGALFGQATLVRYQGDNFLRYLLLGLRKILYEHELLEKKEDKDLRRKKEDFILAIIPRYLNFLKTIDDDIHYIKKEKTRPSSKKKYVKTDVYLGGLAAPLVPNEYARDCYSYDMKTRVILDSGGQSNCYLQKTDFMFDLWQSMTVLGNFHSSTKWAALEIDALFTDLDYHDFMHYEGLPGVQEWMRVLHVMTQLSVLSKKKSFKLPQEKEGFYHPYHIDEFKKEMAKVTDILAKKQVLAVHPHIQNYEDMCADLGADSQECALGYESYVRRGRIDETLKYLLDLSATCLQQKIVKEECSLAVLKEQQNPSHSILRYLNFEEYQKLLKNARQFLEGDTVDYLLFMKECSQQNESALSLYGTLEKYRLSYTCALQFYREEAAVITLILEEYPPGVIERGGPDDHHRYVRLRRESRKGPYVHTINKGVFDQIYEMVSLAIEDKVAALRARN